MNTYRAVAAVAHVNSGATALLNRWRNASGGLVLASGVGSVVAVAAVAGGAVPTPEPEPMGFHYILWMRFSRQSDFEQVALDRATRVDGFSGGLIPSFADIQPPPIRQLSSSRLAFAVPMGYGPPDSYSINEQSFPDDLIIRASTPVWTVTATRESVEAFIIDGTRGISSAVGDRFALNGYS